MKRFLLTITALMIAAVMNLAWGAEPLKFTATNGNVSIYITSNRWSSTMKFEYSKDGVNWTEWNVEGTNSMIWQNSSNKEVIVLEGQTLYVRGDNETLSRDYGGSHDVHFVTSGSGSLSVEGDFTSLLSDGAPVNSTTFRNLFSGCPNINKIVYPSSMDTPNFTNWVSGVAGKGVFVWDNNAASSIVNGPNSVPNGWLINPKAIIIDSNGSGEPTFNPTPVIIYEDGVKKYCFESNAVVKITTNPAGNKIEVQKNGSWYNYQSNHINKQITLSDYPEKEVHVKIAGNGCFVKLQPDESYFENRNFIPNTGACAQGDDIAFTLKERGGYIVDPTTPYVVKDDNNNEVNVTKSEDAGGYHIVMPAQNITIYANYIEKEYDAVINVYVDGELSTENWAHLTNSNSFKVSSNSTINIEAQPQEGFSAPTVEVAGNGVSAQSLSLSASHTTSFAISEQNIKNYSFANSTGRGNEQVIINAYYKHNSYRVELSSDFKSAYENETASARTDNKDENWKDDKIVVVPNKDKEGYSFNSVVVTYQETHTLPVTDEGGDKYSFSMPANDVKVSVEYKPVVYKIEAGDEFVKFGLDKKDATTATYEENKNTVTLSAEPKTGFTLTGIKVTKEDGTTQLGAVLASTTTSIDIKTYKQNIKVFAVFEPTKYTITKFDDASYFENMTAPQTTEAGVGKYYYGDKITFNVKDRKPGYDLESVTSPDVSINKVGDEYSFDMPAKDVTITAKYQPNPFHITALDDYVKFGDLQNFTTVDVTYENPEVKVAVASNEGYTHTGFQVFDKASDGSQIGSDLSEAITSLNITNFGKDIWVKAIFTANNYNIVTDGIATCDKTTANFKEKISFKVPASPLGYEFTSVVVTCDDNSSEVFKSTDWQADAYEFDMPASNVNIKVTRAAKKYNVTYNGDYEKKGKTEVTIDDDIVFKPLNRLSDGYEVKSIKLTVVKDGSNVEKPITLKTENTDYELDVNTYLTENPTATAFIVDVVHGLKDFEIVCDDYSQAKDGKKFAHINDEVAVSASKRDGYDIQRIEVRKSNNDWVGDVADKYEYTFTMPASDVKVATFYNMKHYSIEVKEGNDYINNISNYDLSDNTPNTTITYNRVKGKKISKVYLKKAGEVNDGKDIKYPVTFDDVQYQSGISIKNYWDNLYLYVEYEDEVYNVTPDNEYVKVTNNTTSTAGEYGKVVTAKYQQSVSVSAKDRTTEGYRFSSIKYVDKDNGETFIINNVTGDPVYEGSITPSMPAQHVNLVSEYKPIDYEVDCHGWIVIEKGGTPMQADEMGLITCISKANVEKGVTYNLGSKPGYAASLLKINGHVIESYSGYYDIKPILAEIQASDDKKIRVEVTFEVQDYNIIAKSGVKNVKDKDGKTATTARYMDEITFEVEERDGYTIESVVVKGNTTNDILTKKDGKYSFKMPSEHVELVANYEYIAKDIEYQVVVDGVAVSDADAYYSYQNSKAKVNIDDMIMFGAKTIDGKRLTDVTVGGDNFYDGSSSYVAAAKKYVLANNTTIIIKLSYTKLLTVTTDENVSVDKNAVLPGGQVSYTVAQKPGYTIKEVSVTPADGAEGLTDKTAASGTLTVKKDIELSVEYTAESFNITSVDGFCEGCPTTAKTGETVEISFEDREGYTFKTATYNGKSVTETVEGDSKKYSFVMPGEDVAIVAVYEPLTKAVDYVGNFIMSGSELVTVNDYIVFEVEKIDGQKIKSVTINGDDINVNGYKYFVAAKKYVLDDNYSKITVKVEHEDIEVENYYVDIEDGVNVSADMETAAEGETVTLTIKDRSAEGYDLKYVTYNGKRVVRTLPDPVDGKYKISFKMPAEDVFIIAGYSAHVYNISVETSSQNYLAVTKTKATVDDRVIFTIKSANIPEGQKITAVKITKNGSTFAFDGEVLNGGGILDMSKILSDIELSVELGSESFNIICDAYSSAEKNGSAVTEAAKNDNIIVKFDATDIPVGYEITGGTYNGNNFTDFSKDELTASFTMPAKEVDIVTVYSPIVYNVTVATANTTNIDAPATATIRDKVKFTIKDIPEGEEVDVVTIKPANSTAIPYSDDLINNSGEIDMSTIHDNIELSVTFKKVNYNIVCDQYSSIGSKKTATANFGDEITVTFADRTSEGYEVKSATANDIVINIVTGKFSMPATDANIITVYGPVEYNVIAGTKIASVSKNSATINDVVVATIKVEEGETIKSVKVTYDTDKEDDVTSLVSGKSVSLQMMKYKSDITVSAEIVAQTYAINCDEFTTAKFNGVAVTSAANGSEVSFEKENRPGYTFNGFAVNGSSIDGNTFTINKNDINVEAFYNANTYNVTVADGHSSELSVDKATATVEDKVTVTVTVPAGKTLVSVTANSATIGAVEFVNNRYVLSMSDFVTDVELTPNFDDVLFDIVADDYVSGIKDKDNNNITKAAKDAQVNVTFDASVVPAGYEITGAKANGVPFTVTDNAGSFTMPAKDVYVEAVLGLKEYNVTAGERLTVNKNTATINDVVRVTVAPETGKELTALTVTYGDKTDDIFAQVVNNVAVINMVDYKSDIKIAATFGAVAIPTYAIEHDAYTSITETEAAAGDIITVSANASATIADGYEIIGFKFNNNNEVSKAADGYSFTMLAKDVYVEAVLGLKEYSVTAGSNLTVNKNTATINDVVRVTVAPETGKELTALTVTYGDKSDDITAQVVNNVAVINMVDYKSDIKIEATFGAVAIPTYAIEHDAYTSITETEAAAGDIITVSANASATIATGYEIIGFKFNNNNEVSKAADGKYSFTMPAKDVYVEAVLGLKEYNVTAGEHLTVNKNTATINDVVRVTVAPETDKELTALTVTYGDKTDDITAQVLNNVAVINMVDYKSDIKIEATYTDIVNPEYAIISADGFATPSKTSAMKNEPITVEYANRTADGYQFVSATANGKAIVDAKFTMPAENVTIVTKYEAIKYTVTPGTNIKTPASAIEATVNDIVDVEITIPANKILQSVVVTYGSDKKDNITANVLTNKVSIQMAKYKSNITIDATLSNIEHPDFAIISADGFVTAKNAAGDRIVKAKENDNVTIEFKDRTAEGFTFENATINGAALSGNNFSMPAENVVIVANYKAVEYNVTAASGSKDYLTITKSKATISDVVTFFVANREAEDMVIDKVTVNNKDFEIHNYQGALVMANIKADAEIAVSYKAAEPVYYAIISADGFATPSKTSAMKNEPITVEYANRTADGYKFVSATANGKTIENAKFTMPAENVTIVTKYEAIKYTVTPGTNISKPATATAATVNDIIDVEVSVPAGKILQSVVVTYGSNKKDNITANVLANKVSIQMAKYKSNITIDATLSNIEHPDFAIISADGFATAKNAAGDRIVKAKENDNVTVEFKDRTAEGFTFDGATINGAPLSGDNFTMPAENVVIVANYKAVEYNVTAASGSEAYVTITKSKATISDVVTFFVANREAEDKVIEKVTVNGNAFEIHNYQGALVMADIKADAEIAVSYKAAEPVYYAIISADGFAKAYDKSGAEVSASKKDQTISVKFADREAEGYILETAFVNGKAIENGQFVMPGKDAEINTFYALKYYDVKAEAASADYITVSKDKATIFDVVVFKIANREAEGLSLGTVKVNGKTVDMFGYQGIAIMNDIRENVVISADYRQMGEYIIVSANEFATPSETVAVEGQQIEVEFADRESQGYRFVSAIYNGRPLRVSDMKASFAMPAEDVLITANYTTISYNVTTDENVTADKTSATVNDKVTFVAKSFDALMLDKVMINDNEYTGDLSDMMGMIDMADILQDVHISATYTRKFLISTDEYSMADKVYASSDDSVRLVIKDMASDGYKVSRVTINGEPLKADGYVLNIFMGDYMADINVKVDYIVRDYDLQVEDVKVNADGYCANKDVRIRFSSTEMSLDYKIRFSTEAKAAGFQDIDYTSVTSHEWQEVVIPVPETVDYGIFVGFISVRDRFGKESHDFEFKFAINYSSDLIRSKLSDMVFVDNSKHQYAGYQWLKNGVEILGANKQYYIDAPVLYGNYGLILTLPSGEKRRVCDLAINNVVTKTIDRHITVYPNPAVSYQDITVSLNDFLDEDLLDAEMIIYNQTGSVVQKVSNPAAINTLNLPAGVYSGVLVFGVQKMTFKFVVTE